MATCACGGVLRLRVAYESVAYECPRCASYRCVECDQAVYVRAEASQCVRTHFAHFPCAHERECRSGVSGGGEGLLHLRAKERLQETLSAGGVFAVGVSACRGVWSGARHPVVWETRSVRVAATDRVALERRQVGAGGRRCVGDVVVLSASGEVKYTWTARD